jgi:type I restriction enzyme S subunit
MTNPHTHISSGYKPSPLGPIPEDWEVKRLGEICTHFKSGNTITSKEINEDGLYPVYGGNGLRGHSNTFTHEGDFILIGRQGALCGNINYVEGRNYISEHAIAVQTDENMQWLKYKLENWNLNRFSESSAQPGLSVEKLVRYKLVIPTRLEQNKIADILQLWDTAIAKQTTLIEKLTLRKRGLMQQLLTGKKRLKGFEGEWKEVRLGKIGTAYGGLVNKNKEDFENGNALFITYMNVFSNGKIDIDNLGQVRIMPSEKQEQVQYGDIFFTVSSETPDEVGMASVLLNEVQNTYLNSFCFGYRLDSFKTIVPVYASYLFRGDDFRKEMYKIAQGSTRFNISKTEVLDMRITIPSIEEQTAIASVLVNADKEIKIQKQKWAAMQAQKKGLMQVLLTGKRRIKYE